MEFPILLQISNASGTGNHVPNALNPSQKHRPTHRLRSAGVTLVELLVVVGVIGLMTSLVVPAFSGIGKSSLLNATGNQLADLATSARQNSMARNGMTAIVLVTDKSTGHQAMTLMQLLPNQTGLAPAASDWTQISSWSTLSAGVLVAVDPSNTATCCTFQSSSANGASTNLGIPLPAITYNGKQVSSYLYALFTSSGALASGSNAMFLVANGVLTPGAATATYMPPIAAGGSYPPNYYRVTLVSATGEAKIDRP